MYQNPTVSEINMKNMIKGEPYALKGARTVLRGGKPERAYLSQLFNSMTREKPYHNLNIIYKKPRKNKFFGLLKLVKLRN